MKKFISLIIIVPLLIIASGFGAKKRSPQQGPGLGNIAYPASDLFQPISAFTAANGAPLGHSHAMMFKGYLAKILAKDSGKRGGGFGFYDISDPRNPQSVFTKVDVQTDKIREGHGFGFFRVNERDYVALQTIEGIQIWDWTDVLNPYMTSNLVLPGIRENDYATGCWWVAVQAKYIYVAGSSNGIYIVDASNPAAPVMVKRVPITQTGGFRVGPIFAIGNLLVIASMDALGMATLNISDPENPTILDTDNSQLTFSYSSIVNGNYIIAAAKDNRVHVWDITDPTNLFHRSSSAFLSGGGGYVNYQDGFIHAGMSNDYYKLDMRNPDSIITVGSARSNIGDYDHDFASVIGNIVIVGNDHGTGSSIVVHDTLPDTTPPVVTRVIPAPDAVNQALTSRVGITLSDGIEYATINEETFIVRPLGGQPLEGTYSYQFGIMNFTPKYSLDPDKVYEVVLPAGGVKDYAGNAIMQQYVSRFSTGSSFNLLGCSLQELPFVELGLTSYFEATPFNNNTGNPATYTWYFGDGSSYGPTTDPFASHLYQSAGRYTVLVRINDGTSQNTCNIQHTVYEKPSGTGPANASTILLDASGNYVWNVNPDNNSIAQSDVRTMKMVKEIATGKHPVSLAQDGEENIWVLNKDDANIQIFISAGTLLQTIALQRGSMPVALVVSPDKQKAFVTLSALGKVLKIDVATRTIEISKQLGLFVKGLAVSRDNQQVFVTRFITETDSAEVYMLNAADLDVLKTMKLAPDLSTDSEFGGRGVANYLHSVTLAPDGRTALVPAKKDNVFRGLQRDGNKLNFENTVRAMLGKINLNSRQEDIDWRIDINNGDIPAFSIYSEYGNMIFVSLQGNNRVDVFDAYRGAFLTSIEETGDAPQGLTLSKTGDTLFVHNFLSRTISAYNIYDIVHQVSAQIQPLGSFSTIHHETMDGFVLRGKKIFYNAENERMNQDSYMSCATCHLDGDNDGRVWDLTQLGEGLRNTIPLAGRAGDTRGAVHWTGNFDEIQDFEGQIRELAGGRGFMSDAFFHLGSRSKPLGDTKAGMSEDLDALAAYINSLDKYGDSPYRNADGSMTDAGRRGKIIFNQMQCGLCHSGNDFSDSEAGLFHDVGSIKASSGTRLTKALLGFDCPTLKGLWLSPPYLHDGSAKTLQDALACTDGATAHADLNRMPQHELDDLIAYLMQLDDNETSEAPFMKLKISNPKNYSLVKLNEKVELQIETNLEQVTEVVYYLDGDEIGRTQNVNTPLPYNFNTTGEHTLQAKVFHNGGKLASLTAETKITVVAADCDLGITLFPNPVRDILQITTKGINGSSVKIYDFSGKKFYDSAMQNTSEVFNFQDMPHGVYLLMIEKDKCRVVRKVMRY
jgi:sugar lactone lactonase YvrE